MGQRTHSRAPLGLVAALMLAVALQGCSLFPENYPPPPAPLRPTTAGVVASATRSDDGSLVTLTDGRKVDMPQTLRGIGGGGFQKGNLLLYTAGGLGYWAALLPDKRGNGCWEAMGAEDEIAWDMGDSVLFLDGLELPKAPGYHVDPEPYMVNGHLAWANNGPLPQWMSFCTNDKGQIEWGQKN